MKKKKGFTLAEIIISMSIIGIIAAITIPALLVSTNEKTMESQKKALHARMAQAMSQIEDMRVYEKSEGGVDKSSALNFITKGLSEVYRITKTCDKSNLVENCNFPEEITTQNGSVFKITSTSNSTLSNYISNPSITFSLDTEVAGFKTANGESIALFYNPKCYGTKTDGFYSGSASTAMCVNMIYDLNGANEAPNEVGKDVGFVSVFFPKDPDIVLPITYGADATESFTDYETAIEVCKNQNHSLILPNWEDGMSIALNKKLTNIDEDTTYLVTGAGSTSAYQIEVSSLKPSAATGFSGLNLRCVYSN